MSHSWLVAAISVLVVICDAQFYPEAPFPDGDQDISRLESTMEQLMTEMQKMAQDIEGLKSNVQSLSKRVDTLYFGETMWSSWSPFGSCSQSCVSSVMGVTGFRTRTRECVFKVPPFTHETPICEGSKNETVSCTPTMSCSHTPAPIDSTEYIGEYGGTSFTDEYVWNSTSITGIRLRCGDVFDSIQARYGSSWGPVHGEDYLSVCTEQGTDYEYLFNSTEYITGIHGEWGDYMDAITITTNERVLPRCGGSGGGEEKTVTGSRLVYLKGRSGCYVDGLQPVWALE